MPHGHHVECPILQGWLDITYLSADGQFRLSRGNKGTLFVLVRDPSPRERLLQAVESRQDADVEEAIQTLQERGSGIAKPAKSAQVFGRWRLRWSKQVRRPDAMHLAIGFHCRCDLDVLTH